MKNCIGFLLLTCFVPFAAAHADVHRSISADGTISFTDRHAVVGTPGMEVAAPHTRVTTEKLYGEWIAQVGGDETVELELRSSGGFVLDFDSTTTPERLYRCGDWTVDGGAVALDVRTEKAQSVSGEISESSEPAPAAFEVLNATADLLVVRMDGRMINFRRNGGV